MAEQVDGDPGGEIEIFRAILGNEVAMLSAHRPNFAPGVDGHQRGDRHRDSFLRKALARKTTNGGPPLDYGAAAHGIRLWSWLDPVKPGTAGTTIRRRSALNGHKVDR